MSANSSPILLEIKEEINEEYKEYAESAMNELLGWYGYCSSNNNHSVERFNLTNARMSTPNFASCLSQSACYSSTNGKQEKNLSMDDIDDKTDSMSAIHELTKMSPQMKDGITTITSGKSPPGLQSDECGWCKRVISIGSSEFSATSEGLKFCSEPCFTQSRRASYKRAKTCDWCKHIRHAVSYVDFQDGASQLQFCSDKCLNQYKMQIFCKETQAHLDLNPHLKEKGNSSNENLITPDLWMRNCRSRSLTPDQRSNDSMPMIKVAPVSKLLACDNDLNKRQLLRHESTPSATELNPHLTQKVRAQRKRRSHRFDSNSSSIISSGNISEITNNNDSSNENRNITGRMHPSNIEKNRMNNLLQPTLTQSLKPHISPSATKSPQLNDEPSSAAFLQCYQLISQQPPQPSQPPPSLFALNGNRSLRNALRQSTPFIAPLIPNHGSSGAMPKMQPGQIPPTKLFPSTGSVHKDNFWPEYNPIFFLQQHQKTQALNEFVNQVFGNVTPASTILMPYPIILPIPLPIPIPLPLEAFLRAAECRPMDKNPNENQSNRTNEQDCNSAHECKANTIKVPLKFTKVNIVSEEGKLSANESDDDDVDDENPSNSSRECALQCKNDLAKFRINRKTNKRAFTKDSTSENNRPLRKRKRIIDCDYLRLKDSDTNESICPWKLV